MKSIERLLLENKAWAAEQVQDDPEYFKRLSALQAPEFLLIGCSDSRVPANEITGTQPGEIFVQRNIANLVVHTDLNLGSVLEFAVVHLRVKHVIVCGHYGCGGIRAAMTHHSMGALDPWLRNIKDVYRQHAVELDAIVDLNARANRLTELNVQAQVRNLARTAVIQRAWHHETRPHLHGWAYGLEDGLLKPLVELAPNSPLDPIETYDNL